MTRIVVGVDGSPASRAALAWAAYEASLRGATLEVVHVYDPPSAYEVYMNPEGLPTAVDQGGHDERMQHYATRLVQELVGELDQRLHLEVQPRTISSGRAAHALLAAADGAAMLVLGSRGHGGFTGLLLGSVSQQCVHHATCPVVIIPAANVEP